MNITLIVFVDYQANGGRQLKESRQLQKCHIKEYI
jgi:hypothetical protein